MNLLKQSTAATIVVGPFVDSTDGSTAETAINAAATDVDLYKGITKTDVTDTDSAGSNDFAHVANGHYSIELTAGNTDTLGPLRVTINATGALPVWRDFMVVPAMIYDTLVSGTDRMDAELAASERTEIANEVERQIIDDTDTEKVLEAIINKINSMTDLDTLTLAAITSAIRADIERGGGMLALVQAEVNKVPRLGQTYRHTNADTSDSADVTIGAAS